MRTLEQEFEMVRVDEVELHPENPRRGNLGVLRDSIAANGFYGALVVQRSTRYVLAGNHRLLAAREEGAEELPALVLDVDDAAARRILLADNRTSDLGIYDERLLLDAMLRVGETRQDLAAIGYTLADLSALRSKVFGDSRMRIEDEAPDPPEEPRSRPGEVYDLGDHRLLCGDAADPDAVALLLGDERPSLCVTDPPYGVDYDPSWRQEAAKNGHLAYAASRVGEVRNDTVIEWSAAWSLAPSDVFYCWHAGRHASRVQAGLERERIEVRCQVIWAKPHLPISRGHYHWRHEPCWYAVRKGRSANWIGDRKQTTVWETPLDKNVPGGHSTQKPVFLMEKAIRNHGGDVYEPFAGTGSTLIAAEKVGRRCFAIEIDPGYCDVIRDRYASYIAAR